MRISPVTRLAIFDELRKRNTVWHGRFQQIEFLGRLYQLDMLPSWDARFRTAREDITQHTINWADDWPTDWVYQDPRFQLMEDDERLLNFLAAMVHPLVRADESEAHELVELINRHLVHDGYHLLEVSSISGRPIFEPRPCAINYVAPIAPSSSLLEYGYVQRQIARMQDAIDTDPELAIGTAKEWLETICKTVLNELGREPADDALPGLIRAALDSVSIDVTGAPDSVRAQQAVRRLQGGLSGIGAAVGELRNACGTGHGKNASTDELDVVLARLAVNAATTLVTFIIGRYRMLR